MKKINTLLAVALATVVLMSCGGNKTKEMISKKWQISDYKMEGMSEQMAQMKALADTTKDSTLKMQLLSQVQMVEAAIEGMKKSTLEYKNDGVFEASMIMMGQTQSIKGTWNLTPDNKKIVIVDDNKKKTDTMNVDEVSADKLVWWGLSNGKKATFTLVPAK